MRELWQKMAEHLPEGTTDEEINNACIDYRSTQIDAEKEER